MLQLQSMQQRQLSALLGLSLQPLVLETCMSSPTSAHIVFYVWRLASRLQHHAYDAADIKLASLTGEIIGSGYVTHGFQPGH